MRHPAGEYLLRIRLDNPFLPAPISANPIGSQRESSTHNLMWGRPSQAMRSDPQRTGYGEVPSPLDLTRFPDA